MTMFYKDKQDIINWLDSYQVKGYTLIPDEKYGFVVDVNGEVYLKEKNLYFIPVKFNKVEQNFSCATNHLNTLEFCPIYVGRSFYCDKNKLTSLEFCPQIIGQSFFCNDNELVSLKYSPEIINNLFSCSNNKLTSLEFCPKHIEYTFHCNNNQLTSLLYCPKSVKKGFYARGNPELGDFQNLADFKLIYLEHKRIIAENLSKKLDLDLEKLNNKSVKIKL